LLTVDRRDVEGLTGPRRGWGSPSTPYISQQWLPYGWAQFPLEHNGGVLAGAGEALEEANHKCRPSPLPVKQG